MSRQTPSPVLAGFLGIVCMPTPCKAGPQQMAGGQWAGKAVIVRAAWPLTFPRWLETNPAIQKNGGSAPGH